MPKVLKKVTPKIIPEVATSGTNNKLIIDTISATTKALRNASRRGELFLLKDKSGME
jgi:hypothetical protein